MLTFDFQNYDQSRLGAEHGLDLTNVHQDYQSTMAEAVQGFFAKRDQEGAWAKWLNLANHPTLANELEAYSKEIHGQFDDLVVLGIGGSSLGGLALLKALLHPNWNQLSAEQRKGFPRFHFIDNVDADQVASLLDVIDLKRTLINVISKSGTTAETMAAFLFLKGEVDKQFNNPSEAYAKHFVFTTDPEKGVLRPLAKEMNVRCFEVPDDVGGRFSIFSAVGMLPAAVCGLPVQDFFKGIQEMEAVLSNPSLEQNPAAQNALYQFLFFNKNKPISVFMPYSSRLAFVADWYVQLWAESLGKATSLDGKQVNVGPTPLKAVGATDQHSQIQLYNEGPFDKVITFLQVGAPDNDTLIPNVLPQVDALSYLGNQPFHKLLTAEFEATRASLTRNQRPNATIQLPKIDAYHFAQLLYFFEVQTALAGHLFNIDPFDQPGVELAKKYTYALMGRSGFESLLAEAKGETPAATV